MRLKPASGRDSETKPSAAISCWKPKWSRTNAAEASGSATLSEMADAVIVILYIVQSYGRGPNIDLVLWREAEPPRRGSPPAAQRR